MGKHNIIHVEIPANDPKEAAQFYNNLFGWNTEAMPSPTGDYWQFRPESMPRIRRVRALSPERSDRRTGPHRCRPT